MSSRRTLTVTVVCAIVCADEVRKVPVYKKFGLLGGSPGNEYSLGAHLQAPAPAHGPVG
jgi:hypothetical protein